MESKAEAAGWESCLQGGASRLQAVCSAVPPAAGVTPLHIAAWLGHKATASALLAAGADPEVACLEVGGSCYTKTNTGAVDSTLAASTLAARCR